jgi:hypothetical protein
VAIVEQASAAPEQPAAPVPVKRAFRSYGLEATRRFLKTAIVIDDEIIAENDTATTAGEFAADADQDDQESPPFAAAASDEVPAVSGALTDGGSIAAEAVEPPVGGDQDAEVEIKPLADAFLDRQIVCGVLKPEDADNDKKVVERAVRAAAVADIVIIDWFLRKNSDSLARAILETILKQDAAQNGRLRTVVVYTSATPLVERRDKLVEHLTKAGFKVESPPSDDTLLTVDSCRIRFVQKRSLNVGTKVEELPDVAIAEFAQHSSGLLANFALLGVAALRDATHHVLANLTSKMDAAFVGHRMLLGDFAGAQGFAMSLFMLQMKGVLSLPTSLGNSLADGEVSAWLDNRFGYAEADAQLASIGTDKEKLLQSVLAGAPKSDIAHKALFLPETKALPGDAAKVEKAAGLEFSRFATFVREQDGFNPIPKDWMPTLTLGTVVKLMDKRARYFMCVQPLCDTVRIDEQRYFPFIELTATKVTNSSDNLALRDSGKPVLVSVSSKAGARHYAKFDPRGASAIVADSVDGKFVFSSTLDHRYWWLGDIEPMKAQRIAVDLSSTLARVGIDEYEWLRRGGTAKA